MCEIGGSTVAQRRIDPDHRRMTHRWSGEVAERVVVGALTLATASPEPTGSAVGECPVGLTPPPLAEGAVVLDVEAESDTIRIAAKRRESGCREMLMFVNIDESSGRFMEEVASESRRRRDA
jgi:hypothetical protein